MSGSKVGRKHSLGMRRKVSKTLQNKFASGELVPWNKGLKGKDCLIYYPNGRIWNKGLTAETDYRVKKGAENQSITKKGKTRIILSEDERLIIQSLYHEEKRTIPQTANILGYTIDQLSTRMRKYEIQRRPMGYNIRDLVGSHKGHSHSEETKLELASYKGEKASGWKGGVSFKPYTPEFSQQLKELIKQRDNYTCQLCGIPECECEHGLPVHHIDYDKENCLPTNLISLCHSCNLTVNWNREHWQQYFKNKMESIQDSF